VFDILFDVHVMLHYVDIYGFQHELRWVFESCLLLLHKYNRADEFPFHKDQVKHQVLAKNDNYLQRDVPFVCQLIHVPLLVSSSQPVVKYNFLLVLLLP